MKQYPSISKDIRYDIHVFLTPKYDGNNFRCEWNSKKGFYKFGSRTQLIDRSSTQMGEAIDLVQEKYSEPLSEVFKKNKWKDVICFFEYYGPNSFAGQHLVSDIKTVTLFDVNPYKLGILPPREFFNIFKYIDKTPLLFEGKLTQEIVQHIKDSKFPGMAFEGVVAKASPDNKTKMPVMFKIKSQAWLDKLKVFCNNDISLFEKLS